MEENQIVATKVCYRCKRELPVTSFHKSNGNKDGLQY
jgi:hypothetical protein